MRQLITSFALLSCLTLGLKAQSQTHEAVLTWTDTANPAGTTYDVYQATGACPSSGLGTLTFSLLNTVPLTVKTYTNTSVTGGTTYCWYVTAVNSTGLQSAPSSTVGATIPATFPPGTPTVSVQ